MHWVVLLVGLDIPAVLALLDCLNRPVEKFEQQEADRGAWLRWLGLSLVLSWVLVGYGIVLAYYYAVVRGKLAGSVLITRRHLTAWRQRRWRSTQPSA
jgi:hypothetical protein